VVLDHSRIGWQIDLSITLPVTFLNQRNVIGKLKGLERVADDSKCYLVPQRLQLSQASKSQPECYHIGTVMRQARSQEPSIIIAVLFVPTFLREARQPGLRFRYEEIFK